MHLCEVQKRVLYYQMCLPQRYLRSGKSSKRTSTDKLSRWVFLNVLLNPLKLILLEDTRQHRNGQKDKYKGNNIMLQASHPLQIHVSNYVFRFASYRRAWCVYLHIIVCNYFISQCHIVNLKKILIAMQWIKQLWYSESVTCLIHIISSPK